MFRSFIYLDEEKVNSYKSILENSLSSSTKSISRTKRKSVGVGTKDTINAQYSDEKTYIEEIKEDYSFAYNEFEELLIKHESEDFFDFVINGDTYDLSTLPSMSIIKIKGYMEIPESFDMLNVIEQFKPYLLSSLDDEENGDIIKKVFDNTSADIPVLIDSGGILISGKLNTNYLKEEYTSLEDYEEQEVVFLCKVEGMVNREQVTIFNPARDFIKLNRAMRRAANFESDETLVPIMVDGPILKVEIIAVYK